MHPCVYREFSVSLTPDVEPNAQADGSVCEDYVLYVRLRREATGDDTVFKLMGTGSPERWIEEQVMRQFPDTVAATELRALYGKTVHRLKDGWEKSLGDRLYRGLAQLGTSAAARFWATLIPMLPPLLYSVMNTRAVARLKELEPEVELRDALKAVRDSWLAAVKEAQGIGPNLTGIHRLTLDLLGWPTEQLRAMSLLDLSLLREKALLAHQSLPMLQDEDWAAIVQPILADLPPETECPAAVSES